MAIYMDNPAGRLEQLLRQIKAPDGNLPIKNVIVGIIGVSDDAEIAHAVGAMMRLPLEAETAVRDYLTEQDRLEDLDWHLTWVPAVQRVFAAIWSFTSSIKSMQNDFTNEDLTYLGACSMLLHHAHIELSLDTSEIDLLRKQVRDLEDEIHKADLPEPVKRFLLEQLDRINQALRECALRGVHAFVDAFDIVLGATWRSHETLEANVTTIETKTLIDRFKSVMAHLQLIITAASGLAELPAKAEGALNVLLPGGD